MTELTPEIKTLTLPGGIPLSLCRIPAGSFRMGQRGGAADEEPVHRVVIPEEFFLGEFPVTQRQFEAWTRTKAYDDWFQENRTHLADPASDQEPTPHANAFPANPEHPAENVTWWEARGYCEWLTRELRASGQVELGWAFDLPSEAQWEYACRAGSESIYWSGDTEADLERVGWLAANSEGRTHRVGEKGEQGKNTFGLSDMHGNVLEWCLDYYDARQFRKSVEPSPAAPWMDLDSVDASEPNPVLRTRERLFSRIVENPSMSLEEDDRRLLTELKEALQVSVDLKAPFWSEAHKAISEAVTPSQGRWPAAASSVASNLHHWMTQMVRAFEEKEKRVIRGGSLVYAARYCRSSFRNWRLPRYRDKDLGFRLCLSPEPSGADRPARSGGGKIVEITSPARSLTSVDGKCWWGESRWFPFPEAPDESVKRMVLGSLEEGREVALNAETVAGLKRIGDFFPGLTHLHVWGVGNLEEVGGWPDGLECLDIRKCPELKWIGAVTSALRTLDLGGCPAVVALPRGDLSRLEYVWLDGCAGLKEFAPLVPGWRSWKRLELHECRFDDLDTVYCGNRGEDVRDGVAGYFEANEQQGTEWLAECKVIVLGDGGVGKTELVRALRGEAYLGNPLDVTHGIRLWKWDGGTLDGAVPAYAPFPEAEGEGVDVNIWDFGGQDLYHNTHRLFLESRAVFVVVWREPERDEGGNAVAYRTETHPDEPVRDLNYWLDFVHAADAHPRVVVVRTGIDERRSQGPPWRETLRPRYRNLPSYEVSSRFRELGDLAGLRKELLSLIRAELGGAEAVKKPKGRVAVRRKLSQWQPAWTTPAPPPSPRPMLRRHEFRSLVTETFVTLGLAEPDDAEINRQLKEFHDSGAVYCPPDWRGPGGAFGESPVIVDQCWFIGGIYELLREGSDAREVLVRVTGRLQPGHLEAAWGLVGATGGSRYDDVACWVMRRFMVACGLLVERGQDWVMPELLPDYRILESVLERGVSGSLVTAAASSAARRTYRMEHLELGPGTGCLLVGKMARLFGTRYLFRYGGLGELVIGTKFSGGQRSVLAKLEWGRPAGKEKGYQGDIVATVFGPPEADAEVLDYLEQELRSLPSFPPEAGFAADDGQGGVLPPRGFSIGPDGLKGGPAESVRPRVNLGRVALSVAGNDANNPGIGFWPELVFEALRKVAREEPCFEVVYYKREFDRNSTPELIHDIVHADLMLAIISAKYLRSPYCMVEFLQAARYRQPKATFGSKKDQWSERVWLVALNDAKPLLECKDGQLADWLKYWRKEYEAYSATALDQYQDKATMRREASRRFVQHEWMEFAIDDHKRMRTLLAAMKTNLRKGVPPIAPYLPELPGRLAAEQLQSMGMQEIMSLIRAVRERMNAILGAVNDEQRRESVAEACLKCWRKDRREEAANYFEALLNLCADPQTAREEATQGKLPFESREEDLKKVCRYWRRRQGLP